MTNLRYPQRDRTWIGDLLSGPAGYAFVVVLILLYVFLSLRPFKWDPPQQVFNGAIRTGQEIRFVTPSLLRSPGPAKWLGDAIGHHEFELRLRVSSSSIDQFGPARIFTVSLDPHHRNLTIGQEGSSLVLRLRTTNMTLNGQPEYIVPAVFTDSQWHDIELYVSDQQVTLQIDGEVALLEGLPPFPLENWDRSYQVALGNELTGDRPWLGSIMRAEVEVDGQYFEYLNGESLELPETYWSMPGWKTIMIVPFLIEEWKWKVDVIPNFACFVPLGFALAFIRPTRGSFWLAFGFVALLSFMVELMQVGFAQRYPSALDWVMNVLGATLGVGCSKPFVREGRHFEIDSK